MSLISFKFIRLLLTASIILITYWDISFSKTKVLRRAFCEFRHDSNISFFNEFVKNNDELNISKDLKESNNVYEVVDYLNKNKHEIDNIFLKIGLGYVTFLNKLNRYKWGIVSVLSIVLFILFVVTFIRAVNCLVFSDVVLQYYNYK